VPCRPLLLNQAPIFSTVHSEQVSTLLPCFAVCLFEYPKLIHRLRSLYCDASRVFPSSAGIISGLPVIRLESGPDLVAKAVSAIAWRDCSAKQAEAPILTAQQWRPD
jgi:hypothetical protein